MLRQLRMSVGVLALGLACREAPTEPPANTPIPNAVVDLLFGTSPLYPDLAWIQAPLDSLVSAGVAARYVPLDTDLAGDPFYGVGLEQRKGSLSRFAFILFSGENAERAVVLHTEYESLSAIRPPSWVVATAVGSTPTAFAKLLGMSMTGDRLLLLAWRATSGFLAIGGGSEIPAPCEDGINLADCQRLVGGSLSFSAHAPSPDHQAPGSRFANTGESSVQVPLYRFR